jgi:hypothetical protein
MSDDSHGFVSLNTLRTGPPDPQQALAEIRRIYFKTTQQTIQHDLAHAISLLKTLPTEEEREKARVYMDGLAQMRSEWAGRPKKGKGGRGTGARERGRRGKGKVE